MIDWSEVRGWVQLLFALGSAVFAWAIARSRARSSSLRQLEVEVAALKQRLAVAEQSLAAVPQRIEFERLSSDVRVMGERIEGFAREFRLTRDVLNQQMSRVDSFLRTRFE